MRDDLDQQLDQFGTDMPAVTWASPAEIRSRGDRRRRTRTTAVGVAAALAAVIGAGTALAVGNARGPALPAASASTAWPSPSPSAAPSPSAPAAPPSASPSGFRVGQDGGVAVPAAALLRGSDISSRHRVDTGEYLGESYGYTIGICREKGQWDGAPAHDVTIPAKSRQRQMISGGSGEVHVIQQVAGYRYLETAVIGMAHERAGFEHCGTVDVGDVDDTFEIIDSGFAGDESMLVKHGTKELLVFVRAGSAYTSVELFFGRPVDAADAALARTVGQRAAQRICAAMTVC